jgi:hypothetical protein
MLNDLPLRLLISLLTGMAHVRSQKLTIEADICDHYQEAKLMNLSVGKQVGEGELHANKDDAINSSGPCGCKCKCSGGVAVASLEGLKLDIAIQESRLNLVNPSDEIPSELCLTLFVPGFFHVDRTGGALIGRTPQKFWRLTTIIL